MSVRIGEESRYRKPRIAIWPALDPNEYHDLPAPESYDENKHDRLYARVAKYVGRTTLVFAPDLFSHPDNTDLVAHASRIAAHLERPEMRLGIEGPHYLIGFNPEPLNVDLRTLATYEGQEPLRAKKKDSTNAVYAYNDEWFGPNQTVAEINFAKYAFDELAPQLGGVVAAVAFVRSSNSSSREA